MSTSPFESLVDEAERAAGVGDYASAERLLREALAVHEAQLGPDHPDLANTLNNLGVVCERTNNLADAERSYRRAFAIASASLPADHPYVLTSRQNLSDFCAARGMPIDLPAAAAPPARPHPPEFEFVSERAKQLTAPVAATAPAAAPAAAAPTAPAPAPAPAVAPPSDAPPSNAPRSDAPPSNAFRSSAPRSGAPRSEAPPAADPLPRAPLPKPERPEAVSEGGPRRVAIGVLIVIAIAIIAFLAIRLAGDRGDPPVTTEPAAPGPVEPPAAPPGRSPVTSAPGSTPPDARSGPPAASIRPSAPAASGAPRSGLNPASGASGTAATAPEVVDARLCRSLSTSSSEWVCTPPGDLVAPGPLTLYMRLRSKTDTVVQCRWYQGTRLRQAGELNIPANATAGYRTYSRRTIEPGGTGDWRVELRTKDGRVLREERFVVR